MPLTLGNAAVLKLKVDCHFPGAIDASVVCVATVTGPSASYETFVVVMADILTGVPFLTTVGCTWTWTR